MAFSGERYLFLREERIFTGMTKDTKGGRSKKKVTGAKVTGAVVALTMCLNSVPSTALAESESPRGGGH